MSIGNWISGKVFSYVHGKHLVYNTCWEDPRLDKEALKLTEKDNLLVITSAGCNALSYALTGLNHIDTVDMNYRQNALLELKMAGIRELDFENFFQLFGQGYYSGVKKLYREKLRDYLTEESRNFWDKKIVRYFGNKNQTLYFHGTTGYIARRMNFYVDHLARFRAPVMRLFNASSIEEQHDIWYNEIRKKLWSRLMCFLFNRNSTLSMLGVPRAQRLQIERTYDGNVIQYIQNCLDEVFTKLPIRDNYFWRVYVTGSYSRDCCPEYLVEENFNALKGGLVNRISVHTDTVEHFLRYTCDHPISRFVLLDHMDWLSDQYYDALVSEWDAILSMAAPQTRLIWRSGGLNTDYINTVPVKVNGEQVPLGNLLTYDRSKAEELHRLDRVHTYGSFHIADLR